MNSEKTEGVEPPTPTEAEARRRYLQWELDRVTPSPYDNIIRVKFFGEENSKHLNITPEQYAAIKKIIVPAVPDETPAQQATLTITITGRRWSDLECALEEVKSLVSEEFLSGMGSNETGSFTFDITDYDELDQEDGDA